MTQPPPAFGLSIVIVIYSSASVLPGLLLLRLSIIVGEGLRAFRGPPGTEPR